MSISVIKQGLLDTLQDVGRYGYQHLGINPCGVMDTLAAAVANILVGNEKNEAVIELHFPASSFLFHQQCLVALSGADFHAMVDGEPIPLNTPALIGENCTLEFKQFRHGERCYLAVHRGFKIPQWLNSYSTHLKAGAGGYEGRRLKKEDVLNLNDPMFDFSSYAQKGFFIFPSSVDVAEFYAHSKIRCVEGNEYLWLTDDSKKTFLTSLFHLSVRSDRMGYCIQGDTLNLWNSKQLVSSGVTKGTVQLLPSGELIILMADHQTTGGYPKIAHVISADIPKLAQMRPNRIMQFEMINLSQAEELFIEQERYLQHLNEKINLALNQFFCNANYRPEL